MTLLLYIQYLLGSRSVANSTASYIAAHTLFDTSIQCTWQVQWHVRTFFWHALVQKLRTLIIGINHAPVESRSQTIPFRSARYMYYIHVSAWSNTAELNGLARERRGKAIFEFGRGFYGNTYTSVLSMLTLTPTVRLPNAWLNWEMNNWVWKVTDYWISNITVMSSSVWSPLAPSRLSDQHVFQSFPAL